MKNVDLDLDFEFDIANAFEDHIDQSFEVNFTSPSPKIGPSWNADMSETTWGDDIPF